jgi:hypothetical protein
MKAIPGYEGLYAVTKDGRVWSYPRKWKSGRSRNSNNQHLGKWLKPQKHTGGYLFVGLSATSGQVRRMYIHRVVALTYLTNGKCLAEVNHKNTDKTDNRVSNLGWCTRQQNAKHARKHNLYLGPKNPARGERHPDTLLRDADVLDIRRRAGKGEKPRFILKDYPIARTTYYEMISGHTWKHLPLHP